MSAISVIIPVYNVEKYLRRCLDSVLNQTFTDWEAVCVNDGSPDNCAEILNEYAKKDSRFKIINQENGGLSDARNSGMAVASGQYILFLDSDDFIHPQTMEITHFMAVRDKTDMVAFTYDRIYRPQLMVRYKLGLDTDNVIPKKMHKKYMPSDVKSLITDNVFEFATEKSKNPFNPNKKWLVKHCQVWKHLYKKDLIKDIKFIKGILFEDFPWWSEVMLRNPTLTIINLPLYFYVPNFGGIVLSAKQLKIMQSLISGIKQAFVLYKNTATDYQMKMWSENFLWAFINKAFSKVKYLDNEQDLNTAKKLFVDLKHVGAFANPVNKKYKKLRGEIYDFVHNKKDF